MTEPSSFAKTVALSIAAQKKVPAERVEEALASFANLKDMGGFIKQCGDTACGHGFWESHLMQACALAGVPFDTFLYWVGMNKTSEEAPASGLGEKIDATMDAKCQVIWALHKKQVIGDPFIFLGLIGTEVAEAMESCRKGNWVKPDGVYEELADALIRIFDFVARFNGSAHGAGPDEVMTAERFIDVVRAKMAVNESRPRLHGKKF